MLEALPPVHKTYQRKTKEEDRWLKRSGTNYIIVPNAEIFKQYQFVKEKEFVKENEEAFEILRNILIFELESSNSVNYIRQKCAEAAHLLTTYLFYRPGFSLTCALC
jgi:hypothetical protein